MQHVSVGRFALMGKMNLLSAVRVASDSTGSHTWRDSIDVDLGSTNPVLLPIPTGSLYHDVALQVGKDDVVRLINLSNLSGTGHPGATGGEVATAKVPQPKKPQFPPAVRAEPALWVNPADHSSWIFITDENGLIVPSNRLLNKRSVIGRRD